MTTINRIANLPLTSVANASLIAAAPEMLEALELCRNWISTEGKFTPSDHQDLMKERLLKLSEAAIQKARGDQ